MAAPSALMRGSVVLVRFPFSDLSGAKLRPAVVLAIANQGDFVLCQVTSKPYSDLGAIELTDSSFATGSLHRTSYLRSGKLFTANEQLINREIGRLTGERLQELKPGRGRSRAR